MLFVYYFYYFTIIIIIKALLNPLATFVLTYSSLITFLAKLDQVLVKRDFLSDVKALQGTVNVAVHVVVVNLQAQLEQAGVNVG